MFSQNPSVSLLQGLNPEQLSAVTWPPQSALVLAGAGSGKTRVLTTRIAWLLQSGQAGVHGILAVTFTNKAAKEMQTRLGAMSHVNVRAMWLGTFHGLCHRFLRLHHQAAGLPSTFQILDSGDQLALIKRLLKQLNIAEEIIAPRSLQGFINAQKESGLRAAQLSAPDAYTRRMIECYAAYDQTCNREGVVDFAELMLRSYEMLQADETLRLHYQNRFNHILVDEFQDTNKLQYAWLKLMAGGGAAVFAVGDDDQSIYRFRGAHVGNMTALMREFGIEAPIKLEQNYRSDGHILAAANAVIANNAERLGKNLRTEAESGDKIRFYCAPVDYDEAQFIIDEAKSLQREGRRLDDMAVLYRSNAQSRIIEQALFAAGMPYKIYGGLRFYERQEIKHALAYLRLAVSPDDDNALLRVINTPPRGIGTRTIENIQAAAAEQGVSLWQAACGMGTKAAKVAAFVRLIEGLRAQAANVSLQEMMLAVTRDSGLVEYYQTQKGSHQDRLDNLDELINAAVAFKPSESNFEILPDNAESPLFPILAFLSNAALESGENQAGAGEEALQMMTVHAAKGLEFDVVFLTGMEEGLFPSEYSLAERGGLEEERRLMYVAVTRARKRLYISMAQQCLLHGQTHFGIVSRFVEEIPPEVLHRLSPAPQRAGGSAGVSKKAGSRVVETFGAPQQYHGFTIGQNVRHAKFGTGVIIDAVDKGGSARLTINFGKEGVKDLDTAFAKLEAV
ncbi:MULTISPECIES: UvrD-helicase domain-containing protein [unclassified Neisseria]|uniref:UvrD-helicase domain-containing protein n=1 Tax=unclassified Neisseria TaxID=2623750 RepID=UPI0010719EE6|nr:MULTISPECIES: UvrD-helicase domain-containing protein [unclassified Neisseria]MBF0804491.1 UvrD-helicase domain-containing protein [Neisseria sp. 19428wB4_WF04]TFU40507.1 DNA helicase II [Neisseria sp. WF04]